MFNRRHPRDEGISDAICNAFVFCPVEPLHSAISPLALRTSRTDTAIKPIIIRDLCCGASAAKCWRE